MEILLENIPEVKVMLKTTGQMQVDFKVVKEDFRDILISCVPWGHLKILYLGEGPEFL